MNDIYGNPLDLSAPHWAKYIADTRAEFAKASWFSKLLIYIGGIHSRIPLCCIRYHVAGNIALTSRAGPKWDYVPCEQCIDANHRVVMHHCTKWCPKIMR